MIFSAATYRQKGLDAFVHFQNAAANYPGVMSYDQAKLFIDSQSPTFFEFLGKAILNPPMQSEQVVQTRMRAIAEANKGKLPAKISEFLKAFQGPVLSEWKWTDTVKTVADSVGESLSMGSEYVEGLGMNLFEAAKVLTKYLPFIVVGALGIYVFTAGGGLAKLRGAGK